MNKANFYVSANPANYRPVMTNHFEVTVHDLDGMINWADPDKKTIVDSELTLKIANKNFSGPNISQQSVAIQRGNTTIEFPGRIDAFSSTATFEVFVNKSAFDILYSWKMASGNQETGEVGNPSEYWKRVEIDVLTGDKGTLIGTWTYNNCWLQSLQEVTFDNGANEVKSCSVTLKYFAPKWRSNQNI